jgi:hypothetical protein
MKLLVLALVLIASPAFADPKLRTELDALAARIAALEKLDAKDPKTKATVDKVSTDFTAYEQKFQRAYKKALPKQARLKELSDEIGIAAERVDGAPSDTAAKDRLAALEVERTKLEAELAKRQLSQAERDREKQFVALYRDTTKQKFELLNAKANLLQATIQ